MHNAFYIDTNLLIIFYVSAFILLEYNLFNMIIDIYNRIKGANYNISNKKSKKELLGFTGLVCAFVFLSIQESIRILILSYSIYTSPPEPIFNSISLILIYEIILCSLLGLEYVNKDLGFTIKN